MADFKSNGANTWVSPANAERIYQAIEYGKTAIQYGWIPLILTIGTEFHKYIIALLKFVGYLKSEQKPSLVRLLNPLS